MVNTGFDLHLIEPLGFSINEKSLRRAGMDYIKKIDYKLWPDLDTCLNKINYHSVYSISTKGKKIYSDLTYSDTEIIFSICLNLPKISTNNLCLPLSAICKCQIVLIFKHIAMNKPIRYVLPPLQ